jgi:hypothetical protein
MRERAPRVSLEFIRTSPTDKGAFGDNVIAEMNEHSGTFPNPDVAMLVLTATNNDLKKKIQLALSGDKQKIQERDDAEREWNKQFRKQARYVDRIADGRKLVIVQGGFKSIDTELSPVGKPSTPDLKAWGNRSKRSIHAEVESVKRMKSIIFIAATQPLNNTNLSISKNQVKLAESIAGDKAFILSTKRKVDFEELTSGTTYYIAAVAFNPAGASVMSTVIDVVAP